MIDVIPYNWNKSLSNKTTLILGSFDAIHNGHLALINEAKKLNLPIVITIFEDVLKIPSKKSSWQYTSLKVKIDQLAKIGVNKFVLIKFAQIQNLSGQEFIAEIKKLVNAAYIVVGYNFNYGKNRENNSEDLKKQFKNTIIVEKYQYNGQNISTSLLKQLVVLGEVDAINKIAPFPYTFEAVLTNNNNIIHQKKSQLHHGIYGVFVEINGLRYWGTYYQDFTKSYIKIPDLETDFKSESIKILVVTNIRYIVKEKVDDITNQDLIISKNKLAAYLKNRI